MNVVAAYVPGLHEGYRRFFEKHAGTARSLFVFPSALLREVDHLRKDLRALDPELAVSAIRAWPYFSSVELLSDPVIECLNREHASLIMPDEEISRHVGETYFAGHEITYDTVFLRRDKNRTVAEEEVRPDRVVSCDEFDREIMRRAVAEGEKSSDWWRRVGAVLIGEHEIGMVAHNRHFPTEHTPGLLGDSRSNFTKGVAIELSNSIHAEAAIIAEAARRGMSVEGRSLYVTDFPCPPCAKLIAASGIAQLYYMTGYAMVEGDDILRDAGVEIVQVR